MCDLTNLAWNNVYESLDVLLTNICNVEGVDKEKVIAKNKTRKFVYIRHIYSVLAKIVFPEYSYACIGKNIVRDHSTIIYYIEDCYIVKEKLAYLKIICGKLNIPFRFISVVHNGKN